MAERFDGAQFPPERVLRPSPFWRYAMPASDRVALVLLSAFLLVLSGTALAALVWLAWTFLQASFSS